MVASTPTWPRRRTNSVARASLEGWKREPATSFNWMMLTWQSVRGDPMATATLEDMEGEVTCVVFPKAYKKYNDILRGQAAGQDPTGDVFVRIHGKVERDDRGTQVMVSEVEPIELEGEANQPKIFEILMNSSRLNRDTLEHLQEMFGRHTGFDRVELRVEESSGDTMRMELPAKVDATSPMLRAEVLELLGADGSVMVA